MKRLFSILVVFIIVTCSACAENAVVFRNIPWGTNYTTAKSICSDITWYNYSSESHYADTVKDIVGIGEDYDAINQNINMYAYSSSSSKISVAGYSVEDVNMYFAFTPNPSGMLTHDDNNTALYMASYTLEPADYEGVFLDLQNKLSSIYGNPIDTYSETSIFGDKYTYVTYHSGDAKVYLKLHDQTNSSWKIGNNKIYIYYVWDNATIALRQADTAITLENSANEAKNYGNGNISGL